MPSRVSVEGEVRGKPDEGGIWGKREDGGESFGDDEDMLTEVELLAVLDNIECMCSPSCLVSWLLAKPKFSVDRNVDRPQHVSVSLKNSV